MVPPIEDALAVQCVLEIQSEEVHAGHFWVRDRSTEGLRPVDRYLDQLDEIRYLQSYIVDRARRADVPVIENTNIDTTIGAVMDLVLASAEQLGAVGSGLGR
jgi:2-phosphoglycerate kinase